MLLRSSFKLPNAKLKLKSDREIATIDNGTNISE